MAINRQDFEFVQNLVREESAIVLEDGKQYLLETRLLPLVRREKLGSLGELVAAMRADPKTALRAQVVDAMTTNETSFFRDESPFEALQTHILPDLIAERLGRAPIRFWCGACSTGQEPYSIAMMLREHFPEACDDVQILATDLSPTVVAKAQTGRFNRLEIRRGLPKHLLKKYFTEEGHSWQVDAAVQDMVEFGLMNLVQPWPPFSKLDVVFLRNVLIYFDAETKRDILRNIRSVLKPGGHLFLGSAESTLRFDDAFERVKYGRSTCYRVGDPANSRARSKTASTGRAPVPSSSVRRALVVDDLRMHQDIIRSALALEKFEAEIAEDGLQGYQKLQKCRYDVIFLDIQMPNMNGLEFLVRMQRNPETAGTPVIMVSTVEDPETMAQTRRLGAGDYLSKPYTTQSIRDALHNVGL